MKSWSWQRLTSNGLRFGLGGPSSQAIASNERHGILPPPVIRLAIVLFPAPALPRRTSLIFSSNTLLKANEKEISRAAGCRDNHAERISEWGRWLRRLFISFRVSTSESTLAQAISCHRLRHRDRKSRDLLSHRLSPRPKLQLAHPSE